MPLPVASSPLTLNTGVVPSPNAQSPSIGTATSAARADHVHKEALTVLGYAPATKTLTFTDEAGIVTNIDLSAIGLDVFVKSAAITANTLTLIANDGTNPDQTITVDLSSLKASNTGGSIAGDGNTVSLTLVNDNATPGNDMAYGTDGAGAKGWYAKLALATTAPAALAPAASAGTAVDAAKGDHVHALPALQTILDNDGVPTTGNYYLGIANGAVTVFGPV